MDFEFSSSKKAPKSTVYCFNKQYQKMDQCSLPPARTYSPIVTGKEAAVQQCPKARFPEQVFMAILAEEFHVTHFTHRQHV